MKKANIQNGVDYISTLPDPILHLILSRLHSTIEVVRTSVLSTRWKYLWTSIPSLNMTDSRKPNPLEKNEFKEFVYWVLVNRTLDLNSFTLDCSSFYDMSTIGRWIHVVVMHKVKKLGLTFSLRDKCEAIVLPRCLVDCGSLEMLTLKLSSHSLCLKSFTGSKTLKVLRLDRVRLLNHDLVQSFFVNCPLLEELSLINCITHNLHYFSISCPNLKTLRTDNRGLGYKQEKLCKRLMVICPKLVYFEYGGHMANHFSFDVKSLKKAVIELEDMELNAKDCVEINTKLPDQYSQFHAYVYGVILRKKNNSSYDVERFFEELEEVETRRTLTRHLKRVEFSDFNGENKETLSIARFLLEHGNALEEMVFSWSKREKYRKHSMEAMNKVSKFYKASSSVRMITLKGCMRMEILYNILLNCQSEGWVTGQNFMLEKDSFLVHYGLFLNFDPNGRCLQKIILTTSVQNLIWFSISHNHTYGCRLRCVTIARNYWPIKQA
ncbi:F-box domain, FBD domain, Leucine-rich repeat domain, L domain-like protein [Artemisia annua]|uniref:F-box domain, FBD domain, Leucine-rich repeat domain, L domain-like protein n=1 Tax=Artemisia annua TaxID=35608 RepID=A0A2U1L229_ARTAN|nr:F-box domain, FBD domain, Leucine-rich repeat domain, L domain-like protein [Artemisia annua]